jgi:uncharacterized protein
MEKTSLLYAADFHGSNLLLEKIVNKTILYKPDALIIGGDLTGNSLHPIELVRRGLYSTPSIDGLKQLVLKNQGELNRFIDKASDIGRYPIVCNKEVLIKLYEDEEFKEKTFKDEMTKRLKEWMFILESKIKQLNIKTYMFCGNNDPYEMDEIIDISNYIVNPETSPQIINDLFELIADSSANETPFNCPRDLEETKLKERLAHKMSLIKDHGRAIYAFHCPPYNTKLDVIIEIDAKQKQKIESGNPVQTNVGCKVIRELIEENQPLLSLHGHIHESQGESIIGRTVCINPGSQYHIGLLNAVMIVLNRDSVIDTFKVT